MTWLRDANVEVELDGCQSAVLSDDGSMAALSGAKSSEANVVSFLPHTQPRSPSPSKSSSTLRSGCQAWATQYMHAQAINENYDDIMDVVEILFNLVFRSAAKPIS